MKAVLCPVCNGRGVIYGIAELGTMPCHGCAQWGSKGWILIQGDDPVELELGWRQTQTIDLTKCPACGGDRNTPASTGCPMGGHYGSYCSVK